MKHFTILSLAIMMLISCTPNKKAKENGAIFHTEFNTPYGMPPFDEITNEDFKMGITTDKEAEKRYIDYLRLLGELDEIINN